MQTVSIFQKGHEVLHNFYLSPIQIIKIITPTTDIARTAIIFIKAYSSPYQIER